jgi:hypothetical protein
LYKDLTNGKKTFPNLYKTIQVCSTPSSYEGFRLLSLLALLLDIICKLNGKGCSLTLTESTVNISEKLTLLLHLFTKENNSEVSTSVMDLPQCTWSTNVKLVCVCMVMCPLWTYVASKNNSDVFAHRVDLSEQVEKLMKILKDLKSDVWSGSCFKEQQDGEAALEVLSYQLFMMYSLLGFALVLLNNCVCGESASCSGIDLTRKLHSKDHLKTFVDHGGCEFIVFVVVSLNKALSGGSQNSEFEKLLKTRATFVVSATGHLVSSLKRALSSLCKPEGERLSFSLDRLSTSTSYVQQRQRFSNVASTSSLNAAAGSSSEEDWEQQDVSSISQCHSRSGKGKLRG